MIYHPFTLSMFKVLGLFLEILTAFSVLMRSVGEGIPILPPALIFSRCVPLVILLTSPPRG